MQYCPIAMFIIDSYQKSFYTTRIFSTTEYPVYRMDFINRGDMETSKGGLTAYLTKCGNLVLKALIWAALSGALNIGLLYLTKILLGFYLKTPMGPEFADDNPELIATMAQLTDLGFEELSLYLVPTAFLTCLAVLVALKICYLARYISPMGIIGRVLICVLPVSGVVALVIQKFLPIDGWVTAYFLSVFPTFLLFNICFEMADELFPEFDDILAAFQKTDASGKKPNGR
jgi:hypothetical protein